MTEGIINKGSEKNTIRTINHFFIKRPVLSRPNIFPSLCFAVLGLGLGLEVNVDPATSNKIIQLIY